MLRKLFAKEPFDEMRAQLCQLYQNLGLQEADFKTQVTTATYRQAYRYRAEGTYQGQSLVLTLWSSPLKDVNQAQYLECLMVGENPDWLSLAIYPKSAGDKAKRHLGMEQVTPPNTTTDQLLILSNRPAAINTYLEYKGIFELAAEKLSLEAYQLERRRLYFKLIKWPQRPEELAALEELIVWSANLLTFVAASD